MKNILIDNIGIVYVIEFENLREFIKTQNSHYVLKYELDEEEAVYYSIIDCSNFTILAYALDKNFKSENIRVESNKIIEINDPTGNTITLAKIKCDTFLAEVMKEYAKEKKKASN